MRMYKIYMFTSLESRHAPSLRFQAHLAFPQSLPTIQKCQKSLQARPTPTHALKGSAAKIKNILTNDKNGQLVTRYIKNWADTTVIKHCGSLQTLYRLDSGVLRSAQLFIYRNRKNSTVAVYLGIKRIISAPAMLMLAPMISHLSGTTCSMHRSHTRLAAM